MGGPDFGVSFSSLVDSLFSEANAFVTGDGGAFGMAIFMGGLTVHALVGGAELATGQPDARLIKGSFWARILGVAALLLSFQVIFISFSQTITVEAMRSIYGNWGKVADIYKSVLLQQMDAYIKAQETASMGIGSILQMGIGAFFSGILGFGGLLIGGVIGVLAILVMLLYAMVGAGSAALVLCLAPICIPFLIHEDTQGIAISYIKTWLLYAVLFMPMLTIVINVCSAFGASVMAAQLGSFGAGFMTGSTFIENFIVLILGPLTCLAVLLSAPMIVKNALR